MTESLRATSKFDDVTVAADFAAGVGSLVSRAHRVANAVRVMFEWQLGVEMVEATSHDGGGDRWTGQTWATP